MRRSTWLLVAFTLSVLGVLMASACDKETDLGNVPLSPYVAPDDDSGSDSGPADTGTASSSGDSATEIDGS